MSTIRNKTSTNNDIIFAIATNNINILKDKLNNQNVNNIIDTKNNFTPLHFAIKVSEPIIINFLL